MRITRKERRRAIRRRRLTAAALVVLLVVVAVVVILRQRAVDPEALQARAQQRFDAGEYAAATIDLKNVVSADGDNGAARLLLGRTYLKVGNTAGAFKEFAKARELGLDDPELDRGLVRAMILTARYDDAATEIALHGDSSSPEWRVLRGMLDLAQQRLDEARKIFGAILAEHPDHVEARRGLLHAELAAGNAEHARSEVEQLLAAAPADASLWLIKGELDLHDGNAAQARDAFGRALDLTPRNPLAILGMTQAHLALGELDLATNRLDSLGHDAGDDPRVNFLRARIAEERGDENSALMSLRKVLLAAPGHRESLVLAAKLHFALGEFTRAQDYVKRLLAIEPDNEAGRRMLAAIQLASGRLEGLDVLGAATADGPQLHDPGLLALLGTAYLKHGKFADGEASLERAVKLAPESLPIRTQLALGKLSNGREEAAIADLEAILREDPDFAHAAVMLAIAHLMQKHNEQALAVSRDFVGRSGDDALAHNVYGYVLEVTGDKAAARTEFEAALERDPTFHPARINLARLALLEGDHAAGRRHFNAVLEAEPFNPLALMGLAALAMKENKVDEAERLWLTAREHNPDAVAPRLLLARHYRVRNNLTLAGTLIKEAYALAPFAPEVLAEYASIMLETGSLTEALGAARTLTARAPESLNGLDLLGRIYNQMGDEAGLTQTLERIAEIAPDDAGAKVLLGRLAIRRKDYDEVRRISQGLLSNKSSAAAGHELQGDLERARGALDKALAAYARAHEIGPDSSNVLKLDRIERELGKGGDRLAGWLEQHPDDVQVRLVYASYLQQDGAAVAAISEYERMVAAENANPVVLNNLAWLYHQAEDERALPTARRAYELAPEQPEIMDTYGWILLGAGQREQALEILSKAAELSQGNPDIGYHLASALAQAGQTALARTRLHKILAQHLEFGLRKEAESLLATLGAK